jgi:hypothetical protein
LSSGSSSPRLSPSSPAASRPTVPRNRVATDPITGPRRRRRSWFVHSRRAKVLTRETIRRGYNFPAPGNHQPCKGDIL